MKNLIAVTIIASMIAVLTIAAAPRTAAPPSSLELAKAAAAVAQAYAVAAPLYDADADSHLERVGGLSPEMSAEPRRKALESRRKAEEARAAAMKYAEESRDLYERAKASD